MNNNKHQEGPERGNLILPCVRLVTERKRDNETPTSIRQIDVLGKMVAKGLSKVVRLGLG